ncbi:MAG: hypothetical protein ACUVUQ_08210 [Thermodesulfovibrionales bacterium]
MTVTAGNPLDVQVTVKNEGLSAITINRFAVVISGNPVASLGGIGVWGPFVRNKTVSVPAYRSKTFSLRIVNSVPTSLKCKIAGASVTILSNNPEEPNKPQSRHGCLVQVFSP